MEIEKKKIIWYKYKIILNYMAKTNCVKPSFY